MANAAELKTALSHALPHLPAAEHSSRPPFAYAMYTHPGRVRRTNQDACAAAAEHATFVVCDGVGGAAGGEIASQLAAETFLSAIRQSTRNTQSAPDGDHIYARLHQAILAANAMVFQRAQKSRTLRGMATTLVAALLEYPATAQEQGACPTLWLAHAGDSRAYRFRPGTNTDSAELTQLTSDHSLVEEQIRAGIVSRMDALRSPVRNVITRAIGAAPTVEPEIASHAIEPGDLYLLASDGLTRELDDTKIAQILTANLGQGYASTHALTSATLEDAARALIDAANLHGGRDNITVLLLACR